MYGGTTREDPEYPGILSIPDTVSVSGTVSGILCMGGQLGYPGILSIPDTVSVRGMYGGTTREDPELSPHTQLGRFPSIPGYLVFRTLCL